MRFPIQLISIHQSFYGKRNPETIMALTMKRFVKAISGREAFFSLICRSLILVVTFYQVVGLFVPSSNPLEYISVSVLQTRYR